MGRIIAVSNQKGGVGKTTTAINLGACLGGLKKKVLIADMDPQQHINVGLNIFSKDIKMSTYNLLMDSQLQPESCIIKYSDNIDILPSHLNLALAESELMGKVASDKRLFNQLRKLRNKYDFIIIDCPPSLGLLTINSLLASDEVIITIEPDFLAMQGVVRLIKLLKEVMDSHEKDIAYRTLVTRFDSRTRLAKEVVSEVQKQFDDSCFKTMINNTVKLKEAMSQGMPILEYDKQSKGFLDYHSLAKEVLSGNGTNKRFSGQAASQMTH